jgi:hypothetical protein
MHGRVPLARRNLLAEPRRLLASATGVGMAIMLILLLDGLWLGIEANITTYEDSCLIRAESAAVKRATCSITVEVAHSRREQLGDWEAWTSEFLEFALGGEFPRKVEKSSNSSLSTPPTPPTPPLLQPR